VKNEKVELEIGLENEGTNLEKMGNYLEDLQKQLNKKKGNLDSECSFLKFTSPMLFRGGGNKEENDKRNKEMEKLSKSADDAIKKNVAEDKKMKNCLKRQGVRWVQSRKCPKR